MEPIARLEHAIESAESMPDRPFSVNVVLTEVYRQARIGFTDSEATIFAERLERLVVDCQPA